MMASWGKSGASCKGCAFCILAHSSGSPTRQPGGMAMDPEPHTLGKAAGNRGKGRPKGVPNKTTALLKDAILQAAEAAGGAGGMVGYLTLQAHENPGPFMALLGKVLPTQIAGEGGGAVIVRLESDAADL